MYVELSTSNGESWHLHFTGDRVLPEKELPYMEGILYAPQGAPDALRYRLSCIIFYNPAALTLSVVLETRINPDESQVVGHITFDKRNEGLYQGRPDLFRRQAMPRVFSISREHKELLKAQLAFR